MKTILIVDPACGDGREELLLRSGFTNIVVSEANAALKLLQKGMPVDLVITELLLPDRDGLDFVADMRQTWPALPVVVTTSRESIESYLKAANLGVIEYLNKPVLKKELFRIVDFVLKREREVPLPPEAA